MLLGITIVLEMSYWFGRRFKGLRKRVRKRHAVLGFLSVAFWFVVIYILGATIGTMFIPVFNTLLTIIVIQAVWVGCAMLAGEILGEDKIKKPKKHSKKGPAKKRGGKQAKRSARKKNAKKAKKTKKKRGKKK